MPARIPHYAAILIVIGATFIWGTAFPVSQHVLRAGLGVSVLLTYRFGIGTLTILALLPVLKLRPTARDIRDGLVLGVVVSAAFWLQMDGLRYTTVPKSGFITGLFVLFTPAVALVFGERVKLHHALAALISVLGLYGLVYGGTGAVSGSWNRGDAETLAGAVLFGVQIYLIGRFSRRTHGVVLALGQVGTCAVLCGLSLLFVPAGHEAVSMDDGMLLALFYLGIVGTGIVLVAQCIVQASLGPTEAAILFTLEPLFAALLAVAGVVPGIKEHLATVQWAGAGLLLAAPILTEQGDAWLSRRREQVRNRP
ncbi:MAG TPA: DMT family transporter [Stellaceae bacterium]|nr:DMT family transporter [Stellaceae bacterium]